MVMEAEGNVPRELAYTRETSEAKVLLCTIILPLLLYTKW